MAVRQANIAINLTSVTLSSANWSLNGSFYEYTYSNVAIMASSDVAIVPQNASISIVKAAQLLPYVAVSAGSITLYAENAPTGDITVNIRIN